MVHNVSSSFDGHEVKEISNKTVTLKKKNAFFRAFFFVWVFNLLIVKLGN
jgi:hypothetical protein